MEFWSDAGQSQEHELRLEVLPEPGTEDVIHVAVMLDDTEEALWHTFAPPFTPAEVTAAVATAKGLTEQYVARSQQELPPDPLRELGRRLFDAVFTGRGKALYDRCRDRAREAGTGLRVRVVLRRGPDGRDARWMPWEFLYDSRRRDFLALSMLSRLIRDTGNVPYDPLDLVSPPIRALVVGADINGNLGVAEEVKKLKAIEKRNKKRLRLDVLPNATRDELLKAVRDPDYHVFHFIGTGVPPGTGWTGGNAAREGLVLMPDDRKQTPGVAFGPAQIVGTAELVEAMKFNGQVRGVVLDAWYTDGIAAELAEEVPVPGVIGVRGIITIPACMAFALELYRAVVRGEPLDMAITSARQQVDRRLTGSREWGVQTAYMQTPDGTFAGWPRVRSVLCSADSIASASGRKLPRDQRKAALIRAICESNQQALEDHIERSDGDVPAVVRDQLKAIKARLKSL